jgi:succinate dehydrogenase/fumarate reductase flavoprotein subunit
MWEKCALVRERQGLEGALRVIEEIKSGDLPGLGVSGSSRLFNKGVTEALEARNMVELSEMVVKAALMREESRKSHFRTDFPRSDNRKWLKNIIIKKEASAMTLKTLSPVMTRIRPPGE